MGVEGIVGMQTFDATASLTFSVFAFDPSGLPRLAGQARSIGETLA
jgi:hypothetical protein